MQKEGIDLIVGEVFLSDLPNWDEAFMTRCVCAHGYSPSCSSSRARFHSRVAPSCPLFSSLVSSFFLSFSTTREVMPVRQLDDKIIAKGEVGPVTKRLQAAFKEAVRA